MRGRRFFFFFLVLTAGAAAGMFYGWSLRPMQRPGTTFAQLRQDYRTDMVLMVAEVYAVERDNARASARLSIFLNSDPLRLVQESILTAGQLGYAPEDLDLLANLAGGLQPGGDGP